MPLTDSQLAGLIQLVLLQQQDILALQCGQVALLKIAYESGLEDVDTRFQAYSADLAAHTISESSLEPIRALELVLHQLKHPADPVN